MTKKNLVIGYDANLMPFFAECEILNDFWAICPFIVSYQVCKKRKALIHVPSAQATCGFANRKTALKVWNLVRKLDIHFENVPELVSSKDWSAFIKICLDHEVRR
jgi:hypothetical protein